MSVSLPCSLSVVSTLFLAATRRRLIVAVVRWCSGAVVQSAVVQRFDVQGESVAQTDI